MGSNGHDNDWIDDSASVIGAQRTQDVPAVIPEIVRATLRAVSTAAGVPPLPPPPTDQQPR
ncbi:hypothetical protein [Actinokineospora enzanensis]|uniref:hypothetical protein n=1 Tax=Actinokineospora enzanensis TaxID=155975 RepID=UPI00035D5C8B|nr:hypothetical protein [Actinokineospora enzanensis]